jgi:formate dehydrogenase subunit delta
MNIERLVEMANDIAAFFKTEPVRADAIAGVKNHLKNFWEPRMRREIVAHLDAGGTGLDELARAAVESLRSEVTATGALKT